MQSIRSLHRIAALLAGVCGIIALVTLGPAVPAANAQTLRNQIPIVAGTVLELPGARMCTAGAVLESRSWISRVTPIARATRYVVLAKHCAGLGDEIRVGDAAVGTVTWQSATNDLEIVTVPPSTVQRPLCSGASQLHHCTIPPATPKAVGRIILDVSGSPHAIPMIGTGLPAADESFCTSGAVSFVNCSFQHIDNPVRTTIVGQATARSLSGRGVTPGDSGGPVASRNGRLYGIIIAQGLGVYKGMVAYLPIQRLFEDLGYAYEIAAA